MGRIWAAHALYLCPKQLKDGAKTILGVDQRKSCIKSRISS
jgi:hypothetical protein